MSPPCSIHCKLKGLGSMSYTAWMRNLIRWGSAFHSSGHITLPLITSPILSKYPVASFQPSCSSCPPLQLLLPLGPGDSFPSLCMWSCWDLQRFPDLPCLAFRFPPACGSAVLTRLVAPPPPLCSTFYQSSTQCLLLDTFGSLESRYCITTLALVALNSSSRDFSSTWSLLLWPYSRV